MAVRRVKQKNLSGNSVMILSLSLIAIALFLSFRLLVKSYLEPVVWAPGAGIFPDTLLMLGLTLSALQIFENGDRKQGAMMILTIMAGFALILLTYFLVYA